MLAAVAQICSKASVTDNAAVCASVIRRAADAGAALVALPEASDFIAPSHQVHSLTATTEDAFVRILQQQARTSRIEVTVGVHEAIADSRQVYNTQLFINRDGEVAQSYRKCHLFDVDIKGGTTILESATTRAGESLGDPIASGIGQLGLMTCYDLRFPMQSLLMRAKGAQVMTYPSAFTERTGAAHWEVLLRARAIETQSYVLAPAQVGSHFAPRAEEANGKQIIRPGRTSYGHSMIRSTSIGRPRSDERCQSYNNRERTSTR
ncbi:uncharacterized protein L969DRAFT_45692 [Mixia osmundae IAM 14324]|uniref:CN hydrolase domain-containing protein n=1 Tax=Mixia osmundae (strain CBS 9802 / IAM 14324 / JCM 22182 / KY 12970) TaxID=764103 RepID=G7DXH6_MIXOS|nr:uncharacterized protein L969DRAFT_45692 [Mixia osmundae IAM 14324]KEI41220.1 hypothetical protein L969DRAFT_45692 [Mixia osmundae IAM 14324]GAA95286.1 hypothetical protein E5Q_01942 [Mixia osmundae IAM 14324]